MAVSWDRFAYRMTVFVQQSEREARQYKRREEGACLILEPRRFSDRRVRGDFADRAEFIEPTRCVIIAPRAFRKRRRRNVTETFP
jgi:hypothetical protein